MSLLNKYRFCIFSLCVFVHALEGTGDVTINDTIKKFYLSLDTVNFFEAFIKCKEVGMELVSIENKEESAALDTFLDPYKKHGAGENGFWLSGTNLVDTSIIQYYWLSTGTRTNFTNWYPGQPDGNGNGEHCLQWVYGTSTNITGWNDWSCNSASRYVCQYL